MTTSRSVLGVLGLCWVEIGKPTHVGAPETVACGEGVLGVLGLRARMRVCVFSNGVGQRQKKFYARSEKPNTPNTLNTYLINSLILLNIFCVGFVSGKRNLCWVQLLGDFR